MSETAPRQGFVRRLEELLTVVSNRLGYHPDNDIIAVLMRGDDIHGVARWDLSAPAGAAVADLLPAALRNGITTIMLIGYGPLPARGAVTELIDRLHRFIPVVIRLLVTEDRAYCLLDQCPCPAADGTQVNARPTTIAANSTTPSKVILPSRRHLQALVDPDPAAQARTAALLTDRELDDRASGRTVRAAMTLAAATQPLSDAHAARVAVALDREPVRQDAWLATGRHRWQLDLWLDVTRRVPDDYVSAPASLAAWCAWRRGDAGLAAMAWRRSVEKTPPTALTDLIAGLLAQHVTPDQLLWPLPGYRLFLR